MSARIVNAVLHLPAWKEDGDRSNLLALCCASRTNAVRSPGRVGIDIELPESATDRVFILSVQLKRMVEWDPPPGPPLIRELQCKILLASSYKFDDIQKSWTQKGISLSNAGIENEPVPALCRVNEESGRPVIRTEAVVPDFPNDALYHQLGAQFIMDDPETGLFAILGQKEIASERPKYVKIAEERIV